MKKYGAVIATVCALSACGGDSSSDGSSSGSSSDGSEPESTTTADSSIDGQWRVNFNDPDGYDDYLLQLDSGDTQALLYTLDYGNGCYFEDRYQFVALVPNERRSVYSTSECCWRAILGNTCWQCFYG